MGRGNVVTDEGVLRYDYCRLITRIPLPGGTRRLPDENNGRDNGSEAGINPKRFNLISRNLTSTSQYFSINQLIYRTRRMKVGHL